MKSPKVSVVVLNYKNAGLVKQCVAGLFAEHAQFSFEVIVVDNASGDGCLATIQEKFPQVQAVPLTTNRGYAAGNNAGLRLARGEYIVILNPDIAVLAGGLDQLVTFLEAHPRVGLAGPRLVNPDRTVQLSSFTFPTFWLPIFRRTPLGFWPWAAAQVRQYLMADWDHRQNRPVDWLLGACLIVRRRALEQVGLLDERYFLYVEDTDWCRRFWQGDWQVYYVADVTMVHYYQRLSAEASFWGLFNRITWIHIGSWLKYFRKWGLKVPHPANGGS